MTQRGGSATAYGILYQLLGTLGRAVDITLRSLADGTDVVDATLVIEPIGGGGDLQIVSDEVIVVEQWKARSGNGTWSLSEIIQSVLPDLYMASDLDGQVYRFVTEGRMGTWQEAHRFFTSLGPCPNAGTPADSLDGESVVEFSQSHRCSPRALFSCAVEAVRARPGNRDQPIEQVERKLWRVLSRFEMHQQVTAESQRMQIDAMLEGLVEQIEDVAAKRLELCGRILEMAGRGNIRVSPEALLESARLRPRSFVGWNELRRRLTVRLDGRLQKSGYSPEYDVREAPSILTPASIVVITGESGQGKSWQLAALARKATDSQSLVVWVPSARLEQRVDQIAADEIWHAGLDRDGPLTLDRVVESRRRNLPQAAHPWAFVCVDGVHSREEAEYLAQLPWDEWGLRLIISAPREIANQLTGRPAARVEIVETADFSPVQVRDYLARRGRSWADTPPDIRQLLRRPVLCQFYADLAGERDWVPRTEYELMEHYWGRIRGHLRGELQDCGYMQALAKTVFEDQPRYPWSPLVLNEVGVSPEAVQRLKESGWIREIEDGVLECWHDRLLSWAAAKSIATRVADHTWSIEDAASKLRSLHKRADHWGRRLGYLAMDTVWLLADPRRVERAPDDNWKLIESLEEDLGLGLGDDSLYKDLLPTIGSRIVPAVVDRLRHVAADAAEAYPRLIASTLLSIARRDEGAVRAVIPDCLKGADPRMQEVGLRLLPALPSAELIESAWELHRQTLTASGDAGRDVQRYLLSFEAVRCVLETCPAWIQRKIQSPGGDAHLIPELTYLLAELSGPEAADVWKNAKSVITLAVPERKRRSIINCILRYRDLECLDLLRSWAHSEEEFVSPSAVEALAYFDAEAATDLIREMPRSRLFLGGDLSAVLMALAPEATCAAVRDLARTDVEHASIYFGLVDGDRLDRSTIDDIIEWVDGCLVDYLGVPDPDRKSWLYRPLRLLQELHGGALLDALRGRRGSTFEEHLSRAASRWADNASGWLDHEFEAAVAILLRIGGVGLTNIVNSMLRASSGLSQLKGCENAAARPDEETRNLVASLARSDRLLGDKPDGHPIVQMHAIDALAALGENAELIRAIMKWGVRTSPYVAEIRREQPAMPSDDCAEAVASLDDPHHTQFANAILALGFTGRQELRPRIKALFVNSELESDVASCSMLALESLGGSEADLRDRLLRQYRSGHHKYVALRLMAEGDPEFVAALLAAAVQHPEPYDELDQRIIGFLGANDRTRPLVREQLGRLRDPAATPVLHFMMDATEVLDPRDARDERNLWEIASSSAAHLRMGGTRGGALRRLAEVQPQAAFELALQCLVDVDREWDEMPAILLDLAADKAVPLLVGRAVAASDQVTCRVIGIELRRDRRSKGLGDELSVLLYSRPGHRRRVAACLAGYLGPGFLESQLREVVTSDGDRLVCREVAHALRRQQREADAVRLVENCPDASTSSALGTIEEVLGLVDPRVLKSPRDDIGFRTMLRTAPYLLRRTVTDRLAKIEREIEQELKSHGARWD